jgi:hypothetical protein
VAYDEQLANRIRQAFGTRSDITERKMLGGLAFLYLGRMCCGIVGRNLMVRIPDDEFDAVMRGRHVRPMDFTGKPLRGSCTSRHPPSAQPPRSGRGCLAVSGSPKRRRRSQRSVARAGRPVPQLVTDARFDKSPSRSDQAWRDSAATICFATSRKSGPVMSGFGPSG